ncbi:MAG: hypothetical protein WAX12_10495 [Candidatus Microthrix subdominans]|jgi:hypothetical protein|uniref:Uncharacterized protein n=1 Tax=Candidatus Neomicrothrix subdominans TaxID=2954438 RepID=A0A936NBM7_9ACTN|nr:hypothetical protein [Candidatus Microthrix sp.]MBK9296091.1 hypothetical protein [Candidatus Microthrix subdominans]MBK6311835.1 hypothetical protein [Candidatus Microthrix sp.]MBK6968411.1 hypothetical protein [Candidatus Microthrix sp.]MBK9560242.1 hypothetical protein [Candidatus Microthrix sp.]HMS48166.1 hypothetical protein [Candidatus Microthrix sp.]
MIALFWVLCALVSFVIAAVAVGSVTGVQAQRPMRAVYVVEDAVDYVADHLPPDVAAQISYDDVRAVIEAHIAYMSRRGLASPRTFDTVADDLVVVDEDEPLAWVLGEVEDRDLSDEQVVIVLRAEGEFQRSIGAVGSALGDDPVGDE